jgi:hypothetical protein
MAQPQTASADPNQQIRQATWQFIERITPWLLDVGNWIVGGLIAVNLILLGALMTIGPVDWAVLVATTAFALALPLDLAGLCLQRLVRDLEQVGVESGIESYENDVRQALLSADPIGGEPIAAGEPVAAPRTREAARKRRAAFALRYSLGIVALSSVLTLAGILAALWHMAWWTAVAFAVMVLLSLTLVTLAVVTADPPQSPAVKERLRRAGQELGRRVRD